MEEREEVLFLDLIDNMHNLAYQLERLNDSFEFFLIKTQGMEVRRELDS